MDGRGVGETVVGDGLVGEDVGVTVDTTGVVDEGRGSTVGSVLWQPAQNSTIMIGKNQLHLLIKVL